MAASDSRTGDNVCHYLTETLLFVPTLPGCIFPPTLICSWSLACVPHLFSSNIFSYAISYLLPVSHLLDIPFPLYLFLTRPLTPQILLQRPLRPYQSYVSPLLPVPFPFEALPCPARLPRSLPSKFYSPPFFISSPSYIHAFPLPSPPHPTYSSFFSYSSSNVTLFSQLT